MRLARQDPRVEVRVRQGLPHHECLRERQASDISIDELVTGSYHLSSLESLAQGLPTLAFLDDRCRSIVTELTGSTRLPWVNTRLEESAGPLVALVRDPDLHRNIGATGRRWMEDNWHDRKMVGHYLKAYADLLENPDRFTHRRFDLSSKATFWFTQQADDLVFEARRNHHGRTRTSGAVVCRLRSALSAFRSRLRLIKLPRIRSRLPS